MNNLNFIGNHNFSSIKLNIFMSSIDCTWTSLMGLCSAHSELWLMPLSIEKEECIVMHSSHIQLTYSPLISNSSVNVSSLEIHGRFCQDIRHLNKPQILTSEDLHASVHRVWTRYMRKGCQSQTRILSQVFTSGKPGSYEREKCNHGHCNKNV